MTTLVKIHRKGQMTLPTKLRALAGIVEGDLVHASFQRGKIVITPALVIDRSKFPTAKSDYTPEQRRTIDARLDAAEAEYRAGLGLGPFNSAGEMIAHLESRPKKPPTAKKTKRPR
jgi:AbrB family looped-hinge helix DNA binding protein